MEHQAAVVEVIGRGWRSGPLAVARTRRQRRRGLRPLPAGRGLVLRTRSVHGFGMRVPLGIVSLDVGGRVRRAVLLPPRRLFWDRGARWILELPISRPPPAAGMVLRVVPILDLCPGS